MRVRARGVGEPRVQEQLVFDHTSTWEGPLQSVEVIRASKEPGALRRPLLLGVSRKDFVGALTKRAPRERRARTLAVLAEAVDRGAAILRVRDIAATSAYLRVRAAPGGESPVRPTYVSTRRSAESPKQRRPGHDPRPSREPRERRRAASSLIILDELSHFRE